MQKYKNKWSWILGSILSCCIACLWASFVGTKNKTTKVTRAYYNVSIFGCRRACLWASFVGASVWRRLGPSRRSASKLGLLSSDQTQEKIIFQTLLSPSYLTARTGWLMWILIVLWSDLIIKAHHRLVCCWKLTIFLIGAMPSSITFIWDAGPPWPAGQLSFEPKPELSDNEQF